MENLLYKSRMIRKYKKLILDIVMSYNSIDDVSISLITYSALLRIIIINIVIDNSIAIINMLHENKHEDNIIYVSSDSSLLLLYKYISPSMTLLYNLYNNCIIINRYISVYQDQRLSGEQSLVRLVFNEVEESGGITKKDIYKRLLNNISITSIFFYTFFFSVLPLFCINLSTEEDRLKFFENPLIFIYEYFAKGLILSGSLSITMFFINNIYNRLYDNYISPLLYDVDVEESNINVCRNNS